MPDTQQPSLPRGGAGQGEGGAWQQENSKEARLRLIFTLFDQLSEPYFAGGDGLGGATDVLD